MAWLQIVNAYQSISKYSFWLVVYLPLWKIWKSVGIIIPNLWKNKKSFQTTNQHSFCQLVSELNPCQLHASCFWVSCRHCSSGHRNASHHTWSVVSTPIPRILIGCLGPSSWIGKDSNTPLGSSGVFLNIAGSQNNEDFPSKFNQ